MNKVSVITVTAITSDVQPFLYKVIKTVCGCQRQHLTDLTAETKTNIAECINKMVKDFEKPLIRDFFAYNFFDYLM